MNFKSKWIVASVLILSILMLESAFAFGSMRCGTHIISAGERHGTGKYEVLKKCGQPTAKSGNIWVYERPGVAKRVVVFDASGNLSRID